MTIKKSTSAISSYTLSLFHGTGLDLSCIGFPTTLFNFSTTNVIFLHMILIFLFLVNYQTRGNKKTKASHHHLSLPPGPKPWPVVGNLPEVVINKPTFRWIHKLMKDMNTDIACLRLGNVHVIPVTSPQIGLEFLKKQDATFSSRPDCMAGNVISNGYVTTVVGPSGEQWKKMRRVVTSEVLSTARHQWLQDNRAEEADHLVRYVNNQGKNSETGGVVNVRIAAQHYCGNVIKRMIFNKRFFGEGMPDGGPGSEEEEHIEACFTLLGYVFSFCVTDYIPWLRWRVDFDDHEKIIKKATASIRKYQDPVIDERIRQWKNGVKKVEEDWLDILIMVKDANGNPLLSEREIKAQVLELTLAAVDNPSNCVEWVLAEMLNHPEMLQKATEELDRVVGKETLVQESDLSRLNYVKACAREGYRLHPVSPFNVPHVSVSDTTVAGYFIPKGSHVLLSRIGLGRNPKAWDDPLKFKPERHLKDDGSSVQFFEPDLRMISFSIGRRGCPGIALGSAMTTMLLARLLQGFTWSVPSTIDLNEEMDSLFLAKPLLALAKRRLEDNLYPAP